MKYTHFGIEERETIQKLLWEKWSIRSIAKELNRSHSSVSREVNKNFPKEHRRYTPRLAHERAMLHRKNRGRADRLKSDALREFVVSGLKDGMSPEQIAGTAKKVVGLGISHEAIYQYVYNQIYANGHGYVKPGKEDLRGYLKRRHKRRAKHGMRKGQRVFKPKAPSIEERPKVVDKKLRFGDWEGDTIESRGKRTGLNSLLERKSGFLLLSFLPDRTAATTSRAMSKRLNTLPKRLRRTLTTDNGSEMQKWQDTEQATGVKVYFAHPYSSWERGANENVNGLVRWYFPKGTDFALVSEEEIRQVEHALNTRPRKRLGWKTPLEVLSRNGALTY